MKYRVEVEERHTITRETFIEADSIEAATEIAEAQDWRTFDELGTDTYSAITSVDVADRQ